MSERKRYNALGWITGVCAVVLLAAVAWATGRSSGLEAISFVTGAICVWLTVRENAWNFPIGIANVGTFFFVFFQARLYADAGLQIVYLVMILAGWYRWLYGGTQRSELRISRGSRTELAILGAVGVAMTLVLWRIVSHVGGSASFWDASTTAVSLCAQWLLNGKRLENWILWIVVDAVYVPLYLSKGLYLTAILYFVFLCMAVVGLREWRTRMAAPAA